VFQLRVLLPLISVTRYKRQVRPALHSSQRDRDPSPPRAERAARGSREGFEWRGRGRLSLSSSTVRSAASSGVGADGSSAEQPGLPRTCRPLRRKQAHEIGLNDDQWRAPRVVARQRRHPAAIATTKTRPSNRRPAFPPGSRSTTGSYDQGRQYWVRACGTRRPILELPRSCGVVSQVCTIPGLFVPGLDDLGTRPRQAAEKGSSVAEKSSVTSYRSAR